MKLCSKGLRSARVFFFTSSGWVLSPDRFLQARRISQLRPEGRNRRDETRLRGSRGFGGPLRGLGIRPLVSVIRGSRKPLPRGPLELWKGSQGLGGGFSGASERRVCFQQSGERRWAIQRPLRGPVFPDAP